MDKTIIMLIVGFVLGCAIMLGIMLSIMTRKIDRLEAERLELKKKIRLHNDCDS